MPFPPLLNCEFATDTPVHEVPLLEYAIELPPEPTAIHIDPFQYNLFACVVNTVLPNPVHVNPFVDVENLIK